MGLEDVIKISDESRRIEDMNKNSRISIPNTFSVDYDDTYITDKKFNTTLYFYNHLEESQIVPQCGGYSTFYYRNVADVEFSKPTFIDERFIPMNFDLRVQNFSYEYVIRHMAFYEGRFVMMDKYGDKYVIPTVQESLHY